MAAEAFGFVEALAALELESDSLGVAELLNYLGGNCTTIDERGTYCYAVAFTMEEDFVESDFGIDLRVEFFNAESVAFLDAVLFTACFDYCVGHCRVGKKSSCPFLGGRGNQHGSRTRARIF